MRHAFLIPLMLALTPVQPHAGGVAGDFDYYVLALSWSPGWCRLAGDGRDARECERGSGLDFVVHGLWPQYERGYPEYCDTTERDPSRRQTDALSALMSPGLALYQWRKHGRCSGLAAADYYAAMDDAARAIRIPQVFDDLAVAVTVPPAVVEDAFSEANPDLSRDGITVTCKGNALSEVRICLTRNLQPRDCAPDARRDCSRPRLLMEEVR